MSDDPRSNPDASHEDLTGRPFGEFQILRRLGSGAMADVYLADQPSLGRQVAIKVLKRHLAADETYVKRFQREARAAAQLVHANIVQIYEVGRSEGTYYISQEYVQGHNLRQWLDRNGSPDLRLALVIMRQAAAALAKAGQQGIIHRDIKPENIMLTRTGEVKVADFGLARLARDGEQGSLTQVGMTMGTPLYMSPEQIEGGELDPRSDIYSLGATCYQMLAGSPPFSGDTALSIALQHLKKQPDPLENHRPDLPAALCRIVHKMLGKNPTHRFQSAWEVLRELHGVQLTYLGDSWPDGLTDCYDDSSAPAIAVQGETTRQLETLMKTASQCAIRRPRWSFWIAGTLAAFLVGGASAWFTVRPQPLLVAVERTIPEISKLETVRQQYNYARTIGTPEAWQSVIDYFPTDTYWVKHAKQGMAMVYLLREDLLSDAWTLFEELAGDSDDELKASGLAGEMVILTIRGEKQKSAEIVERLMPLREYLDPEMRGIVQHVLRTKLSKRETLNSPELEKWLQSRLPGPG